MQHKRFIGLACQGVDFLLIFRSAKGDDCENLSLPSSEKGRTMGSWKDTHFARNGTDLCKTPSIDPFLFFYDQLPDQFTINLLEGSLDDLLGVLILCSALLKRPLEGLL